MENQYFIPNPALVAANTEQTKIVKAQAQEQALLDMMNGVTPPQPQQGGNIAFAAPQQGMHPEMPAGGLGAL